MESNAILRGLTSRYDALFGRPDNGRHFAHGMSVCRWTHPAEHEVTIYATVGTSVVPMAGIDPSHRVEFFVGLEPECDNAMSAVVQPCADVRVRGLYRRPKQTIDYEEPLWPGTEMSAWLLLDGDDVIPTLDLGGVHISFVQLVPLFGDELQLIEARGEDGLQELCDVWATGREPYWDPGRASCLSSRRTDGR